MVSTLPTFPTIPCCLPQPPLVCTTQSILMLSVLHAWPALNVAHMTAMSRRAARHSGISGLGKGSVQLPGSLFAGHRD
ncbi:hypothetical protein E2C01_043542 [Portunus trituberculatus]|uniref:Uncharacterized protein n=1 Tax=Portunus trituberculatus TaxID=210409 RepID=A0A5B7FPR4_PORTR|nr:hypothetical protein [Portunus trituberculatus]